VQKWKVEKHGQEKRRVWRKLHLAVDAGTHEVICADLSLNNMTNAKAFRGLMRQPHQKVKIASADGAYDTKLCHDGLRRKNHGANPAADPRGLLAGGVCGQKSGGGQEETYREQCLLKMEHGL
jgi:hypothetical protein